MWNAMGNCYEKMEKKNEAAKCYERAENGKDKEGLLFKFFLIYFFNKFFIIIYLNYINNNNTKLGIALH